MVRDGRGGAPFEQWASLDAFWEDSPRNGIDRVVLDRAHAESDIVRVGFRPVEMPVCRAEDEKAASKMTDVVSLGINDKDIYAIYAEEKTGDTYSL